MIVAAAPAPPVPAPPGKPPLPILSSSLRRGSSSWWFSNGTSHGRDSTTGTTSSRATRRRWWSDPDGSQQDYGSSSLEEEEYDYDYDYEDEAGFSGFGGAGELFDEPWFSKVFKMYGFLLPVMLVSMFAATGTKAFLMAMVFPLGQSAISFLLDAVWGRRKGNRDNRWRRPVQEEEEEDYPEDATDFATGDRGNRYSGSSSSYYEGRGGRRSYQSRVSNDFVDAASTAVGADDNTKSSSSSGDGWGGNTSSGGYGGWDEILDNDAAAAAQEAKRSSRPFSAGNTGSSTKTRPSVTGDEDADYTAAAGGRRVEQGVGAPPGRMRMRRQRMPRTMGLGSTRYKQAPLLMRLLVAVFPFMGSWFRL